MVAADGPAAATARRQWNQVIAGTPSGRLREALVMCNQTMMDHSCICIAPDGPLILALSEALVTRNRAVHGFRDHPTWSFHRGGWLTDV